MGVTVRFWKGAWWVFVNHQKKRRAKCCVDEDTALRLAKAIRETIARGAFHLPDLSGPTLRAYAAEWLKHSGQLKASSRGFYEGHLELHIVPLLGDLKVAEVKRADCRRLVSTCREKGLAVTTIRGINRTLSTILSQAVEDDLLPANPALRMGRYLKAGDAPESEPDPFTRDEVAHLLEVTGEKSPEWAPFVWCGVRTGMRLGELIGLQWGDIDWRGAYVRVTRNIVRGVLTTPKNHQCRRIDLSPELRSTLRLHRRRLSAFWFAKGLTRPTWLFPSEARTHLDESNVRKVFNRVLASAELHQRGPHQMRHTFASLLLQCGTPITYVSRMLGHKDAAITLRVYARWLPDGENIRGVNYLDATPVQPVGSLPMVAIAGKSFRMSGEPRRNRTFNPQIKSQHQTIQIVNPLGEQSDDTSKTTQASAADATQAQPDEDGE